MPATSLFYSNTVAFILATLPAHTRMGTADERKAALFIHESITEGIHLTHTGRNTDPAHDSMSVQPRDEGEAAGGREAVFTRPHTSLSASNTMDRADSSNVSPSRFVKSSPILVFRSTLVRKSQSVLPGRSGRIV